MAGTSPAMTAGGEVSWWSRSRIDRSFPRKREAQEYLRWIPAFAGTSGDGINNSPKSAAPDNRTCRGAAGLAVCCCRMSRTSQNQPVVIRVARDGVVGAAFAIFEAALRLVVQHHDELGAIIGFAAQRLIGNGDRGQRQRGRRDTVEHLPREGDAVERVLGVVAVVDRDFGPAQTGPAARAPPR